MKDFLTIKEFSELSGIEQTTLRYWDEIGLFPPAKRNPENNYRYYVPDQIISVNFISVLSGLGIPLKVICEMRDKRTPAEIKSLIERQEKRLDMEMLRLREQYSVIHMRRELIDYGERLRGNGDVSSVALADLEDCAYVIGSPNNFKPDDTFHNSFMRFCRSANEKRINLHYPIGGYHENMDNFLEAPGRPDYFISLDPAGNRNRPAGRYIVGYSLGYYGEFGDLAQKMAAFAMGNALTVSGPVYTMYLHDEICVKDPAQYLSQACAAVI